MTHLSSLRQQDDGQTAKVIFLPSRYYKSKAQWTEADWREDWTERVRHRRSMKYCRTWQEGRDHTLATQVPVPEDTENRYHREVTWAWILFFILCFVVFVLLGLFAHVQPAIDPVPLHKLPLTGLKAIGLITSLDCLL